MVSRDPECSSDQPPPVALFAVQNDVHVVCVGAYRDADAEDQPHDGNYPEQPQHQGPDALYAGLHAAIVVLHAPASRQSLQDRAARNNTRQRKQRQGFGGVLG